MSPDAPMLMNILRVLITLLDELTAARREIAALKIQLASIGGNGPAATTSMAPASISQFRGLGR